MKAQMKIFLTSVMLLVLGTGCTQYSPTAIASNAEDGTETINTMLSLLIGTDTENLQTIKYLDENWDDGYIPMLLDVIYFSRGDVDDRQIFKLLEKKTGEKMGRKVLKWYEWLWNREQKILPYQGDWMARIYKSIDPKFEKYFKDRTDDSLIRLDEVRWGGVRQDGIPPLRGPKMILAEQADYLDNDNVVFGISINGDHRAYPKRILAWHEMFVDKIGGEKIAGVYCTLCGTVIAYNTVFEGKNYNLGTSGFLYRSNKVMYDRETQSLWNTIEGKPVIGPLINSGIELSSHSVVTTTWGEWKKLHPSTTVLSLDTGHNRNYDEGNAYNEYFATDDLMFNVPELDERLLNKDEVLIIRADKYKEDPLAISAKFLVRNPVYQDKIGDTPFVVVTDKSGANRVYATKGQSFKKVKNNEVTDSNGTKWKVEEERLVSADGTVLDRLPYHRIFWFAWYNTYKNTRLVK
jgi:hypothetical protein